MLAEDLAQLVLDAERLLNAAHALSAMALDEYQRRGTWADGGAPSAAGWAARRTGSSLRSLRARARTGAGLRLVPGAAPAARAGRLSPTHVAALADCARRHPDLAARDETVLVAQAEALDADSFGVVARQWEERAVAVDGPDPVESPRVQPVDELHVSRTFDGRYQLNANLSAETGQLIHAALEADVDRQLRAARDGDPSVPLVASQVRAAALVDLVAQSLRREPSASSAPDRYRWRSSSALTELENFPCRSATPRRSGSCWAPTARSSTSAGSPRPGRRESGGRSPYRDGGCVFPSCDRPPSCCDIHHCRPWQDGGSTSLANGALLYRKHHTFVHHHHWTIAVEHGQPITRKPDGTPHVIHRWQAEPRPTKAVV